MDEMKKEAVPEENPLFVLEKSKLGIWTFLATEVLLFGALFTAYTEFRVKYPDLFYAQHLRLNRVMGFANTVILICSSLSVAIGVAAIRKGKQEVLKKALIVTLILAGAFLVVKGFEYREHFLRGELPGTNIFFSLYYIMTAVHALHVVAGMAALSYCLIRTTRGDFSAEYAVPVEISGIYWHFVDLVWIYLFPMLYLMG
jgi:cytochrome c oxidase subunit III